MDQGSALSSPNLQQFGEKNRPFSELRTCRTRVQPGPFSDFQTCRPESFLRTPNLSNQRSARSFLPELRTCQSLEKGTGVSPNLPNQGYTQSFLRTPNQGNLVNSELNLQTPSKNTILDHFVFVTFPCGVYTLRLYIKFVLCLVSYVLDQVWCLIVSIPDLCLLSYFHSLKIVLSFVFFFQNIR